MRQSVLRKSIVRFAMAAFLLFASPAIALGAIRVLPENGADAAMLADVQKTALLFNQVLQEDMKLELTRDVTLIVCPSRENYAAVLQREFKMKPDKAAREAALTGGMSSDRFQVVALNGGSTIMRSAQGRASDAGHELFHQLQAQLANGKNGKAMNWLKEGTADLIGARIAERSGYQSMEKWKLDRINTLRNAPNHAVAAELLHSNLDKWATMMEQKKYPYQMSDLMVFYLLKQQPGNKGYEAIAEYFRLVGTLSDGDKAFEQAFDVSINQFLSDFEAWFINTTHNEAQVEVIVQAGVLPDAAADIENGASLSRRFFKEKWGADLRSSQRIVLTPDKNAYAGALAKEFGLNPLDAGQKAKNSFWSWAGSTTVLDLGTLTTRKQRLFITALTMVQRFQAQTAAQQTLAKMNWLNAGSAAGVAAQIVETSGVSNLEKDKAACLNALRKAEVLPELRELQTPQAWSAAVGKYGSSVVNNMAELAALHLMESYGVESIYTWLKAVKDLGDAEAAFTKVYGMTSAQFSAAFNGILTAQLQKK
ncbi:hypothetical protein [Azotosporobacter soli]|uniref:hypothetical protein n=1 Tax=Azotosporobacter soli TaxID=3055040 RepID=UPI0031FF3ABB